MYEFSFSVTVTDLHNISIMETSTCYTNFLTLANMSWIFAKFVRVLHLKSSVPVSNLELPLQLIRTYLLQKVPGFAQFLLNLNKVTVS